MRTATVADMKARLSDYLKESESSPVVVTRNGKVVAVLVGVADESEAAKLASVRPRKLEAILDAAKRRLNKGAGIPHDEFWKKVDAASDAGAKKSQKPSRAKRGS